MKVVILFGFIAAAQCTTIVHHPMGVGTSMNFKKMDPAGNYAFMYNEGHDTGATFRKESGNAMGHKMGSYGLKDIDGRMRIVNYVADEAGFRADIKSNEPGVESKDPAAVSINKDVLMHHMAMPVMKDLTMQHMAMPVMKDYTMHPMVMPSMKISMMDHMKGYMIPSVMDKSMWKMPSVTHHKMDHKFMVPDMSYIF